jgi:subtilisin-like proprotein convertase family protein
MKSKAFSLGLLAVSLLTARAQTTNEFSLSPGAAIPDGNPVGFQTSLAVSGVAGAISALTVTLDITGGFNGDLYAYLVSPQGQLAVLLNRPGVSADNAFGYDDAGLSLTLADAALNNVHDYGAGTYSVNGAGQVTGVWQADGRNVDPQSAGSVLAATATTSGLGQFAGDNANGTWTFFIADLGAGGGTAQLNSVMISVMTVPEPQAWVILGGGLAMLGWLGCRRRSFPAKRD